MKQKNHIMKNLIITLALIFFTTNLIAQTNEIKARSEFFSAEESYNSNNFESCIYHLNKVESLLGATNSRVLYLKVKSYYNLQDWTNAYEAQKQYFENDPDSNDQKFNEIVRLISIINKNAADIFIKKAFESYDLNDNDEVIRNFKKAIEILPESAYLYYNLGSVYCKIEDFEKSIYNFKEAIKLEPDYERAYYFLGYSYININDYVEAIYNVRKAIEINPENEKYYNILANYLGIQGQSYYKSKQYDQALDTYKKIISINSNYSGKISYNIISNYDIGKIYYLCLEKLEESKPYFNKVIELDKANSLITIFSIYFLGKKEEALRRMNLKLIEAKNTNNAQTIAGVYYNYACLFSIGKNSESALEYLELALQNGYSNFGHINHNSDIDNIRNDAKFKTLIEKYKK